MTTLAVRGIDVVRKVVAAAMHALSSTAIMSHSLLASLPVELLIDVASHLSEAADLHSLALVNVTLNHASTFVLYGDIVLRYPTPTRRCLEVLNYDPKSCAFERDLPSLVRSFVVDWGVWYADGAPPADCGMGSRIVDEADARAELYMPTPYGVPKNGLRSSLERAVLRMRNVRRFSCWESFLVTPPTFAGLVAGPAGQSLRVLGVTMEDWPLHADP